MTESDYNAADSSVVKGASFDTTIERMGHGGVGIGQAPDGRVCFVPSAFPGDQVRVTATKAKKSFVEARCRLLRFRRARPSGGTRNQGRRLARSTAQGGPA